MGCDCRRKANLLILGAVAPWGRVMAIRKDLVAASKSEAEGGTGNAEKWWDWNEEQVKMFV